MWSLALMTAVLYDCVCSNGQYVVAGSDDGCAVWLCLQQWPVCGRWLWWWLILYLGKIYNKYRSYSARRRVDCELSGAAPCDMSTGYEWNWSICPPVESSPRCEQAWNSFFAFTWPLNFWLRSFVLGSDLFPHLHTANTGWVIVINDSVDDRSL